MRLLTILVWWALSLVPGPISAGADNRSALVIGTHGGDTINDALARDKLDTLK